jgi:cobaltochelatase CobT
LTLKSAQPILAPMKEHHPASSGYSVFTRRFDKVVSAAALNTSSSTERAWGQFMEQTLERRTAWELRGLEQAERIRAALPDSALRAQLITLLVDHSGSMRGERMLMTAAAVDVARTFLVHLGVDVEVLGFTTRSWRGGWSRRLWQWTGKRKRPGRLCDLLHIVYEAVDSPKLPGTGTRSYALMLDPHLLKENVDGEAILWAASRQEAYQHRRKAIIVISDGAPVDDSTLMENGPHFMMNHLAEVVSGLQTTHTLMQLKIGREFESAFPHVASVDGLGEMGTALFELLSQFLLMAETPQQKVL